MWITLNLDTWGLQRADSPREPLLSDLATPPEGHRHLSTPSPEGPALREGYNLPSQGAPHINLKTDSVLAHRVRARGRCELVRERPAVVGAEARFFLEISKVHMVKTRLRNKPTLIGSVHRDLGQQGCDQVTAGHTPVLAKVPGLLRGFRLQLGRGTDAGSELPP